ncbi:MAG: hypothetical protein AAF907_16940, partial [Planctomycetota bacterium]
CGGLGGDRATSLESGAAVQSALKERGHDAVRLELPDSHEDCVDALMTLDPQFGPFTTGERPGGTFDVAFVGLHGPFGEDGRAPTVLDRLGLPHTGSGVWSSVLSWRKRLSKARWAELELPTAPWAEFVQGSLGEGELPEEGADWPFPFIVKPDAGGSSRGVSRIDAIEELPAALKEAHAHDYFAVAEQFIPGDDWTVPVLNGTALPPVRFQAGAEANSPFSFAPSQANGGVQPEAVTAGPEDGELGRTAAAVAELGAKAAEAIFADGLCEVDLRVAPDGSPWLLELNAVPRFSAGGATPRSAGAAGISPGLLYERCCRLALGDR